MKVQFLKLVVNVGHVGDIKEVSDSYARNFLIPKWLAKPFTETDAKNLENKKKKEEQQRVVKLENRNEIFEKLNGKYLQFHLNTTDSGKTFGSIGEKEIAQEIEKLYKLSFSKSEIEMLWGHIKKSGKYDVLIKLWGGISAKIVVTVQ